MPAPADSSRNPSLSEILQSNPWVPLEQHLDHLRERVDASIVKAQERRSTYRDELLRDRPELIALIRRPSAASLGTAETLLATGTVAAADGTISPVPLLGGSKTQVGVVIVFTSGEVVDLVTRVFEAELTSSDGTAAEFFAQLRRARSISNLLARAIVLFGERRLLLQLWEWPKVAKYNLSDQTIEHLTHAI